MVSKNLIKNILVPHDDSKYAKKALEYAIDIAKKGNTKIFLLRIVDEHEYLHGVLLAEMEGDYTIKDTLHKFIKSEVINEKKKLEKITHANETKIIKINHHVIKGNPIEAILEYAKAKKIDLIIIGSQGLKGIEKLKAIGSTSRKVSELSKCPVMIIH
ncbi:MAG: universal stress protein [Thaumarchaeota archaeon]|nr:universal stress protein [Nitrososphaerota archaeon]MBT5842537.1 universal stress protein [Nitrososphaerota archaeon]MBT6469381.1 universal stress protein [Nitrososphaerota archaeon]